MPVFAQTQDTIYYNWTWRETTANNASYYRTKIRLGAGWQVTDHYINGELEMTGTFSDDSCHIRQGLFTWHDTAGRTYHEAEYVGNKQNGKDSRYYKTGQVEMVGTYNNGKKAGDFMAYYPSGKLSGKAKYADDYQISCTCYNEDGSVNPEITDFIKDSEFPGGDRAWLAFINKHIRYPNSAVRKLAQGVVVVQFIINEEGKISDAAVIKSVDSDIDAEAVRIIYKSSGKWPPAIYGGRLVKSYKKQSISFSLNPV